VRASLGRLNPDKTPRVAIPGLISFTLGLQVVLSSFFVSLLEMKRV
jgi:hypothetical protein